MLNQYRTNVPIQIMQFETPTAVLTSKPKKICAIGTTNPPPELPLKFAVMSKTNNTMIPPYSIGSKGKIFLCTHVPPVSRSILHFYHWSSFLQSSSVVHFLFAATKLIISTNKSKNLLLFTYFVRIVDIYIWNYKFLIFVWYLLL